MKKLGVLLATAVPLVCAISDGKARTQTFPGLPVIYVAKLAFESSPGHVPIFGLFPPMRVEVYGEISAIDAPNPNPRVLARGQGPTWSPNGRQVAFCLSDGRGLFYAQIVNADGTGQIPLTAIKADVCPSDWSPNGEKLAFTDSGRFPSMVAITDADGRNFRRITEGFDPQWSPDGKQLVFYRNVKGTKERRTAIWIANVDGTGARKIIEEDAPSLPSASWNSLGPPRFFDRNQIVFTSGRAHDWCIFRVNLDGTGLEKIVENGQFDLFHPSFSPDGKQVVVQGDRRTIGTDQKPEQVILLFDLATEQWTRLAVGTHPSVLWETTTQYGEMIWDRGSAAPMPSGDTSLIAQGKSRYLYYKCDECHGPNGEGGPDGPELTTTQMNAAQISKTLENPSPDAYMKGMPNIPVNHPDHQALVAYVLSFKVPANPPQSSSPVPHKLSAAEKAHILDGDFSIEQNVTHLPDGLRAAVAILAKEHDFKMANPGEKYQETDALSSGPALPFRRLLFAGISKEKYFLHYEKGGWGHSYHVAVFTVNPEGKISFLWGGAGFRAANDLAQLRTLVSSKAFADSNDY